MSAVPHPTTQVFAFSVPKIKGPEIYVALNLGVSSLHVLHASRPVWQNLFQHLSVVFGTPPRVPVKLRRMSGAPGLPAPARAKYIAAYCDYRSGLHRKLIDAARAHGLPYYSWRSWCSKHVAECEAAFATATVASAPILKPGGAIL